MGEGLSEFVLMCAVAALRWALLGGTHWSFAGNKRRARRAWRKVVAEASALAVQRHLHLARRIGHPGATAAASLACLSDGARHYPPRWRQSPAGAN